MFIEIWYDKYTRSWVTQLFNSSGEQQGTADYVHTKEEALLIAERLQREHGNALIKIYRGGVVFEIH